MPDKKIALTGGIATGKTTVANRFRELGAIILDADQFARKAVDPGTLLIPPFVSSLEINALIRTGLSEGRNCAGE